MGECSPCSCHNCLWLIHSLYVALLIHKNVPVSLVQHSEDLCAVLWVYLLFD